MGMDAVTSAAVETLLKQALPELIRILPQLRSGTDPRAIPGQLKYQLSETIELLALVQKWMGTGQSKGQQQGLGSATEQAKNEELSDEAAMQMLESLDEDSAEVLPHNQQPANIESDEELSDDQAMALLAGMDSDAELSSPAAAVDDTGSEDISDEEAMALLEEMDQPAQQPDSSESSTAIASEKSEEMSDDEAMNLLAAMDEPAGTQSVDAPADELEASNQEPMSDDQAMALLDEMDSPANSTTNNTEPAGEMSDDQAAALLADMDSPSPKTPEADSPSADDEALALLAAMEGGGDSAPPTPASPAQAESQPAPTAVASATPVAAPVADETGVASVEEIGEVPEFSNNDFASDPEMMQDFLTNCDELMETLDEQILELERNPEEKETIEAIFRAAHTLKGAAGMFGFKAIERVMHRAENLFDLVRKGKMQPNSDIIDVVFQGMDILRSLLEGVRSGEPSGTKTAEIVRNLELAASGQAIQKPQTTKPSPEAARAAPAEAANGGAEGGSGGGGAGGSNEEKSSAKKKKETSSTIRVDLERLDHLVNLVGELVIDRTRFVSIEENLRNTRPQPTIAGNMSETVQLFGRHMNEIQEIIMKVRMVPIGNAFNKFTRIVRDLSRTLGKEIELMIDGETTELDKTLVEQIGDPLVHLIRNSCDHGIEDPETREQNGKPRGGRIFLSARQEGNHIVITIEDDGKGIPAEIIRKKGIEKGLISEDDKLSERDIFNLILEPGFSTAEKVTNVSGRGVGMDVVKKQISKLKGLIDIDSQLGRGTTITIQLPLTLAIVQSLLVESRNEVFAIPITSIIESRRIEPEEIQKVGEAEIIKLRDNVLPLLHLDETLHLSTKHDVSWYSQEKRDSRLQIPGKKRRERHYVVIVGSAERRFGIIVDNLLNQQEMVIKTMGPLMTEIPCVAGGSVLGNGEVVLVLDIQELESIFRNRTRSQLAA